MGKFVYDPDKTRQYVDKKVKQKKNTVDTKLKNLGLPSSKELKAKNISPEFSAKHPTFTKGALAFSSTVNKVRRLPGLNFLDNMSAEAGRVAVMADEKDKNFKAPSTGNKKADKAAKFLGNIAGYAVAPENAPTGLGLRAGKSATSALEHVIAKKTGKTLANSAVKKALINGPLAGFAYGTTESMATGKKMKETVPGAVAGFTAGELIGAGAQGIGKGISKVKGRVNEAKTILDDIGNNAIKAPESKPLPKKLIETKLVSKKVINKKFQILTPEKQAINDLQVGIEKVQNAIGHKDVLAVYPPGTNINDAYADIAKKTGVDIPALMTKVEKSKTSDFLGAKTERARIGQVAGAYKKPGILFDTKIKKPIAEQPIAPIESPIAQPSEPLTPKQEAFLPPTTENWKDKSKLSLKRETMERNIEDIAGPDAPQMKQTYLDPIKSGEAERIRYMNEKRQVIKGLDLTKKERQLIQRYGEGYEGYTLDDLKRDAPHNWEKIVKAAETFRSIYDEALDGINESLVRNGYAPVPKRENYFPHFTESGDIFEMLGIAKKDNTLPTDMNGLTADLKPGKNWFGNILRRKGNQTDLDAVKGFDNYLEGASRLIYHTDNIQRLRGLENRIREDFADTDHLANFVAELREYTNNIAGKKSMIDRAFEDIVGRRIYGIADKARQQVSANMVGANVGSALTSFIPITQSLATTSKPAFIKGMLQTIANVGVDDGFVQQSDFLTRRMGSDKLVKGIWGKTQDAGYWLFKVIDNFTSQTIVRGKYNEGIAKGMHPEQAMKMADDWAAKIMADRSLGQMPTLFNSKTLNVLTQFQLEVNNQLSFMMKDIPRNFDKVGAASALAQVVLYGYAFNNLYEQAIGRRPAFDPINLIGQAYNDYNNPNLETKDANYRTIQNVANQLPFASLFTGGRIPLENALPDPIDLATGKTTPKEQIAKVGWGLISPTGGMQYKKMVQGREALKNEGAYTPDKTKLMYPISTDLPNKVRGLLFGKNAFPETREYYEKNRNPLGTKQTKTYQTMLQQNIKPKEAYNLMLDKKYLPTRLQEAVSLLEGKGLQPAEAYNTVLNSQSNKLIKPPLTKNFLNSVRILTNQGVEPKTSYQLLLNNKPLNSYKTASGTTQETTLSTLVKMGMEPTSAYQMIANEYPLTALQTKTLEALVDRGHSPAQAYRIIIEKRNRDRAKRDTNSKPSAPPTLKQIDRALKNINK